MNFKDARGYVYGMTDGLFDFKTAMERTLELNRTKMTVEQADMLTELIETLNESLGKA